MAKFLNMGSFGALMSFLSIQTDRIFNSDQSNDIAVLVLASVNMSEAPALVPDKIDLGPLFNAIKERQKIEAIKHHRALTGLGLKESKDAVESIWPWN